MIVAQANTPGLPALPATVQEIIDVDVQMARHGVRTSILEGESGTPGGVIENMGNFSCIHLACHATQNQKTPLDSAFHLHNGQLQLRSIIKHNLRNADLAFLSVCRTSAGASGVSEEAAHLAGGMMMAAGYRVVVGSMWSIQDVHAPTVAKNFYAELLRRGGVDGLTGLKRHMHYTIPFKCSKPSWVITHRYHFLRGLRTYISVFDCFMTTLSWG